MGVGVGDAGAVLGVDVGGVKSAKLGAQALSERERVRIARRLKSGFFIVLLRQGSLRSGCHAVAALPALHASLSASRPTPDIKTKKTTSFLFLCRGDRARTCDLTLPKRTL
jgi:hypothetical protein